MVRTVAFQAINVGSNPSRDIFTIFMYLLLVSLPFLGSFASLLFGRYNGSQGAVWITTSCLFSSLILSVIAFYDVGVLGNTYTFILTD